jgi:HNH endonuclease
MASNVARFSMGTFLRAIAVQPTKKRGRKPNLEPTTPRPGRKEKIPKAIREQTWLTHAGPVFKTKCLVKWCTNEINVFDFHTGHNIPEAKGGTLDISNLRPICARCNLSMGSAYTIDQWNSLGPAPAPALAPVPAPVTTQTCFQAFLKYRLFQHLLDRRS